MLHYLFAALAFVIYANQVCPLLETQTPLHLALPLIIAYFMRVLLAKNIGASADEKRIGYQLKLDFGLFVVAGVGLAIVNFSVFEAAWHSNVKAILGMTMLVLFVAIDLALTAERRLLEQLVLQGKQLQFTLRGVSFAQKFSLMAIAIIVSITLVLFLRYAREIALSHHEKWDGSGIPMHW